MKDYVSRSKTFLIHILLLQGMFTCAQQNMMPPVRAHHSLVYDDAAKEILLTGGSTPLDDGNSFKFYNDIWSFNGSKWTLKGNAGDERSGIALAYDRRGKSYTLSEDLQVMASQDLNSGFWKTIIGRTLMKFPE